MIQTSNIEAPYVYEPSTSLYAKVCRRLTVKQAQNRLILPKNRTIISFTFDDCPASGLENGVRPLEKEGWLSTVYVACGLFGVDNHLGKMMGPHDAKALHANGHEVAEHTYSHRDSRSLSLDAFMADIEQNQSELNALGIPASDTFAYPYGETYPGLKKALQKKFIGSRGINKSIHTKSVDLNQIGSLPIYSDTIDMAIDAVRKISNTGGWLTLFTHDVRENPSSFGCTPENLVTIINEVKKTGAEVLTIKDAISALRGAA